MLRRFSLAVILAYATSVAFASETARMEAFHEELAKHATLLHLPGLSVAVMEDGQTVFRDNFGFSDVESKTAISSDSIFWVASVTKTFSAIMLMQYVQEGRLSLDDRITSYPFTSVGFFPQRVVPAVRVRHVLSHTSEGVPGETFIYHGGRFNFLSGVFNAIRGGGNSSFMEELHARIIGAVTARKHLCRLPSGKSSETDEGGHAISL